MKKILLVAVLSVFMATSAGAFSLPNTKDLGGDKVKLNKCLMDEGQKALTNGKLTKDTVQQVAENAAMTCATKLALKTNNDETVKLAVSVMESLIK